MVRLLPCWRFQCVEQSYCFNPTMVRLLQLVLRSTQFCVINVSIPQWCDCCEEDERLVTKAAEVSIPQWCDCCDDGEERRRRVIESFNPTMVRLLQNMGEDMGEGYLSFNPTMVRLLR